MSTATLDVSTSTTAKDHHLVISLFDSPDADIVIRSQDSHHIQVPKIYIVNSSSVLGELVQKASDTPRNANAGVSLPVVQLPETGEILHCLLTFIFPITPRIPPTFEEIMELLSVAQKYQMGTAVAHIRASAAQQNPLPTGLEPALRIYALAQKYGLRQEALQTAKTISKYPMAIEDFDDKLDIMPGASLYELWKYHERVREVLASDLAEFTESGAHGTITGLKCTELSSSKIPRWLDQYIESMAITPHLFDFAELYIAMAHHLKDKSTRSTCKCASMSSQTIRQFWEALVSVVDGSFEKAESALFLVREREDSQAQFSSATPQPEIFDVSDTNLILRSSDLFDFRVHKPVLAVASPVFKGLFPLPQPPDSETIDGFPVIQLSEDSELLNCLVSMLYHLPVIPSSYDKVLHLLAACQKYEMESMQSLIRSKVKSNEFPAPKGTEAFAAYAIASGKGLIPEMENAASLTLDHPMTFETVGEGLRLFEGSALRDLANYRRRCSDNLVTCLRLYLEVGPSGPSNIWVGCPEVMPSTSPSECQRTRALPGWLNRFLSRNLDDLKLHKFTQPLNVGSKVCSIEGEYCAAFRSHDDCNFCLRIKAINGLGYRIRLLNKLSRAKEKESVRRPNGAAI